MAGKPPGVSQDVLAARLAEEGICLNGELEEMTRIVNAGLNAMQRANGGCAYSQKLVDFLALQAGELLL